MIIKTYVAIKTILKALGVTLLFIGISTGVSLLMGLSLKYSLDSLKENTWLYIIWPFSVLISYAILFRITNETIQLKEISNNIAQIQWKMALLLFLGTVVGLQLLDAPFHDLFIKWFTPEYWVTDVDLYKFKGYNNIFLIELFTAVIIAPIFEELLFRKYMLGRLLKKHSLGISLSVSACCFMLIHWETPANLISTFIVGLVFGYIYYKTKNIGYTIFLHFINNLLVNILEILNYPYSSWLLEHRFDFFYWLMPILGVVLLSFSLVLLPRMKH